MKIQTILILLLLTLSVGCDPDWPTSVENCGVIGELTLDGEAISEVKVVFVPQVIKHEKKVTQVASGLTDDRGTFELKVDAREAKKIRHGRYRVLVSKIIDGEELFHESYNIDSDLVIEVDSQEAIQRPKLDLKSTGTL